MSTRAEEEESLFLLGENSIHTTFEDKSANESMLRHQNEPKDVPYKWDSLIEHSIMEPPCICSAPNSAVQQLGLSWAEDDHSDDEDESYLLQEFPDKKCQSVLSDIKKTPIPLGRSTNLNYYDDDNRDTEETEERKHDEPTKRDPPPDTETSKSPDERSKEDSGCDREKISAEKKKLVSKKEDIPAERKVGTNSINTKEVDSPASKPSVLASGLLEKLLLSAASSDVEEGKELTWQAVNDTKQKKGKERKKVRAKVGKSPMLLDKMNNLNSVLRKLKKESKKKMKKKQSFNIAEHINNDPQLKEDMHRIYSMLKDVLHVQSQSVFQEDDESFDGDDSIVDVQEEDDNYKPDAIDYIINMFAGLLSPVTNFFGSISSEACEPQLPANKKKIARRHSMKIDGILKCKSPCVQQPDTESPRPRISFSYSLDEDEEEEQVEPRRDLLDYIAKELEGLGVPIDTSHSSFSSDEEEDESEDDLTNFMVIGR